ncbi:PfkB domain protein [Candidatus Vecturithrix granuli]|uniref:PfkB domain protein n=1 Tax=Vecturithrix granuli TaxID=1499967 RepID=A0A081C0E8_VECG1|nr:PfkB domain protein [Candidatus Vecturithrix granuli]
MQKDVSYARKACLIGNFNIDLIIRNVPNLPVWGQEVAGNNYMQVSAGQAAYTGFALHSLGVPVSVIGYVGDDLYGRQIRDDLIKSGIEISGLEMVKSACTAITVAIVRPDGERAFVSDFSFQRKADESIIQRHWQEVKQAKYVGILGIFCLPGFNLASIASKMDALQSQGKITVLDTGWDSTGWPPEHIDGINTLLKHTTIFMPNLDEAQALTGYKLPEDCAAELRKRGAELVIVKLGKDGSYAHIDKQTYCQEALPANVYDAVGAGDVFNAGFLYAFENGWEIPHCLIFGNAASAIYISRSENRFPNQEEVYDYAKRYYELPPLNTQDC